MATSNTVFFSVFCYALVELVTKVDLVRVLSHSFYAFSSGCSNTRNTSLNERVERERQQLAAALVVNVSIKVAKRRQRIRDVADPTRLRNAASYDTYSSLFAAISECKQQQ